MSVNGVEQDKLAALMAMACERRVSVRLRYRTPDGDLESVRVRLARFADGVIYVGGPEDAETRFAFHPNQALMGYFELGGRRYQFLTRARKPPAPSGFLRAKSQTRLTMDLPPGMVEEQYQRCDYRIELAGRYTIPVSMVHVDPLNEGACPAGARRCEAQLVDISASGLGVSGDLEALDELSVDDQYYVSFRLPDPRRELDMLVRVRHVRRIPEHNICRVGCAFEGSSGSNLRRDVDQIIQFVMREQLELAKRQRG